ncbi:uncharacterized protein LODBEIA_P20220 [Lodderomyces beijingensis]|uniref:SGNH hydrolase-type esterase domain-containing protein n=1 Tax=Lodderomyces beijingensis TaxID=1775926 RepID=A0ABP0ZI09_9ASCO
MLKFVLFGDSITQFSNQIGDDFALQPALQNMLIRKFDVLNRGYSGYNSEHARLILPKILQEEGKESRENGITLMTIFFGTNDAFTHNELQPVAIDRYRENIGYLVTLAQKNGITPVVIGPGLHDSELVKQSAMVNSGDLAEPWTTNKRNHEYSEAAKSVAKQHGVAFIDLWNRFREEGGWSEQQLLSGASVSGMDAFLNDGVHYTSRAYRILFDEIVKAIEHETASVPTRLADWKEIDPKNINSIFN